MTSHQSTSVEQRPRWTVVAGCVLGVVAVSALSRALLPPLVGAPERPPPVVRDGAIAPAPEGSGAEGAPATVRETEVPTAVGKATARVVTPSGDAPSDGWPSLVLVAGSGPSRATSLLPWAERLAESGVAAIVYDKRTEGYSFVRRDFTALAEDAVAAAEVLRATEGVDPDRVGAAGFSEGGWIVPLMAEIDPRLAAMVQLSGPNVSPNEQIAWTVNSGLVDASAPRSARSSVLQAMGMQFPGETMRFGSFDPRQSLAAAEQPLLTVFGLADGTVPVEDGAHQVLEARSGQDRPTEVRMVPDLGHSLTGPEGGPSPIVVHLIVDWLQQESHQGSSVRGGEPVQEHRMVRVPETPGALTPALMLSGGAVLVGFILNRIGGRKRTESGRRTDSDRAAGLALAGGVGINLGLGGLVLTGIGGIGLIPMVLSWGIVKAGGLAAALAGALAVTGRNGPPSQQRPLLRRAGALLAAAGGLGLAVISGGLRTPW